MNLKRILENYRAFPRTQIEDWGGPLGEVMTALFDKIVPLEHRSDTAELLDRNRIELYSMFDFPSGPSYNCELHVLTVDDCPVGFTHREGKGDWVGQVLDNDSFTRVAIDLATAAIRQDTALLAKVDLEASVPLKGYVMHFLDPGETMFVLRDPRHVYRLNEVPSRHRAYFVDEMGQVHQVSSIGAFTHSYRVHGDVPDLNAISIVIDGTERMADATQLFFELVPGQGDIEAALAAYRNDYSWSVVHEASNVNRLMVNVTHPCRWDCQSVWVQFFSSPAMARFLEQYPPNQANSNQLSDALLSPYGLIHQA